MYAGVICTTILRCTQYLHTNSVYLYNHESTITIKCSKSKYTAQQSHNSKLKTYPPSSAQQPAADETPPSCQVYLSTSEAAAQDSLSPLSDLQAQLPVYPVS